MFRLAELLDPAGKARVPWKRAGAGFTKPGWLPALPKGNRPSSDGRGREITEQTVDPEIEEHAIFGEGIAMRAVIAHPS